MLLLLAAIGVALVALGTVVLLRFPDRPGGDLRLLGLEVSSVGAGLPLIALGVVVLVVGVTQQGEDGRPPATDGSGGGGGGQVAGPPPDDAPACIAAFFAARPRVSVQRQRSLPAGAQEVDVLGGEEPKRETFGLVLTDRGEVVGAAKLSYDVDVKQYDIDSVVDAACEPARWSAGDVPGLNPPRVGVSSQLRIPLGERDYVVQFTDTTPEVEMELLRSEG